MLNIDSSTCESSMQGATTPLPRTAQSSSPTSNLAGGSTSSESLQLQQISIQDSPVRESMSTEWTDEKHSLYLKSMEASFVNELYNSFDLLGWRSEREQSSDPKFSGKKHQAIRSSSGKFKVLRRGCWGKINFERHNCQLDKEDGCGVLLANPWIRHFRSACKNQVVVPSALQENVAFGSLAVRASEKMRLTNAALGSNLQQFPVDHPHICHYDSVDSNIEVTDQNFIDEDLEVEKNSSNRCNAKRMKATAVASAGSDQVVPTSKFSETTSVTKNFSSSKQESPEGSNNSKSAADDCCP